MIPGFRNCWPCKALILLDCVCTGMTTRLPIPWQEWECSQICHFRGGSMMMFVCVCVCVCVCLRDWAGNAMTTSILSAALFSMMVWVLPGPDGRALLAPPSPRTLCGSRSSSSSGTCGDSDEESLSENVTVSIADSDESRSSCRDQGSRSRSRSRMGRSLS